MMDKYWAPLLILGDGNEYLWSCSQFKYYIIPETFKVARKNNEQRILLLLFSSGII